MSSRHGFFWWSSVLISPCLFAGLIAFWYARRRGIARSGRIRLGDPDGFNNDDVKSNVLGILASIPYFVLGIVQSGLSWIADHMPGRIGGRRGGYRNLNYPSYDSDADAALLNDEFDD